MFLQKQFTLMINDFVERIEFGEERNSQAHVNKCRCVASICAHAFMLDCEAFAIVFAFQVIHYLKLVSSFVTSLIDTLVLYKPLTSLS